jgi:hypothetical protein
VDWESLAPPVDLSPPSHIRAGLCPWFSRKIRRPKRSPLLKHTG